MSSPLTRRRFLQQTFAFSAVASGLAGSLTGCGLPPTLINETSPATAQTSHLLMLGDYGADIKSQSVVAQAMQNYVSARSLKIEALLMLGDNFYGTLTGADDARWQTQFEQMYPATVFDCPAYAIPGNHDYEYFPNQKYPFELQYAKNGGTRWKMPSQWYQFAFPAVNPLITFFALDSNMPFADGQSRHGTFYCMTDQMRQDQLAWLTQELQQTRNTPFTAVMGHHPIYSDGLHGDNPQLIADWDPLLRKSSVHLYLGGHDHDLQHLEFAGHPTSFFLSGGGGAPSYPIRTAPSARTSYAAQAYGFSHLEATAKLLTLRHIDSNGNIVHAFTKAPDGTVTILAS